MELPDASAFTASAMPFSAFRLACGFGLRCDGGHDGACGGVAGAAASVVPACSTAVVAPSLARSGFLSLRGGFRCGGRRRDHCSGLSDAGCDGGSADVAGVLTAWPTPPCALVLAAVGLGVRGRSRRSCRRSVPSGAGAAGAVSAASEAEAAIAAAAMASGAVALSVAGVAGAVAAGAVAAAWDGDGNGVGRHHGRSILRCLGLIRCRGVVA